MASIGLRLNCLVTAGPTFEPLDSVRRLTNFSTGRLGCELALELAARGHCVTLLLGEMATWPAPPSDVANLEIERFTTGADLRSRVDRRRFAAPDAVFHAAAVGDFAFGRVYERQSDGTLLEVRAGKLGTRGGSLFAELIPMLKILNELRPWFPSAFLAGWKYEVDGTPEAALGRARDQIASAHTDLCILNGPAYGPGFGWVASGSPIRHIPDRAALFAALACRLAGS
jgi:phosphopantothenoylcysteine decarboxylase/phosphopantothenate--cysteine ligase